MLWVSMLFESNHLSSIGSKLLDAQSFSIMILNRIDFYSSHGLDLIRVIVGGYLSVASLVRQ